ncbi:MAG: 50S ribosomal protein L25 [Candidatus Roizmanbacteria bacterium]
METKNHQEKHILEAQARETLGKGVRSIRKGGIVPSNLFGAGFISRSISVSMHAFEQIYKMAHETGIVYIKVGTEEFPTLISKIQYHPLTDKILHVDFRKIDLKKKIETTVPVKIVGESIAVNQLGGILLSQTHELLIEALPADIPEFIEVDISGLKEVGAEYKVTDLPKFSTYEIKEEDKVIVSITAHKEQSIEAQTASVAPEVITEKPTEDSTGDTEGSKE